MRLGCATHGTVSCIIFAIIIFCTVSKARIINLNENLINDDWFDETSATETCDTAACARAAELLKQSLNTSVDPCEDFYEFACGGWIAQHPVPPTESHWNQFGLADRRLERQLKDIFEEVDENDDPSPVNMAKNMYRSCVDEDRLEKIGLAPLVSLFEDFGGWPIATANWKPQLFSWERALALATRKFAVTPFIGIYVYLDRKNSSRSVITVDQGNHILPRGMLADPEVYSQYLEAYANWIAAAGEEMAKASGVKIPATHFHVSANKILHFEIELAKLTVPSEERRDPGRMYNPMSVRQLQDLTDGAVHGVITWWVLLKDVLSEVPGGISHGERVIVKEPEYLQRLAHLLNETPPETIANYVMWRLVHALGRETTRRMRDLSFQFDQVFSGVKEDIPRWRECIARTGSSMPLAAGYKFVQRHFDHDAKTTADEMVEYIRDAFKSGVRKASWMDAETRKAAQAKADAMAQFIGFPEWFVTNSSALNDYYKDLEIGDDHFKNVAAATQFQIRKVFTKLRQPTDRSEWISGAAVVNAYYNPLTNAITFPAGILQSPFFSKDAIEALNFGSIGVVIGHEITHGFDDVGRQSDQFGNLAQWWSPETSVAYVELADCFVKQYDNYRVPQADLLLGAEAMVNGLTTLGENIADSGAVRQAFHAYQHYIKRRGRPEPRLPGLPQFTPQQLFFLGFATVWCESATPESLLHEILNDPHSPHRYRVIGSLANSPEFSKVWQCPHGSNMNPSHKCRIW